MQNAETLFPQAIYLRHLTSMNGLHFTRREIDVIACLLHARGTVKIASLLNIAPTTVITHIQKVREKLKCNSREAIIDFIEKSHNLLRLKMYYSSLVIYAAFEKSLKTSSKQINNPLSALIVYCKNRQCTEVLERHLQNHLKLAGIEVKIQLQTVPDHKEKVNNNTNVVIFILDKENYAKVKELQEFVSVDLSDQTNYYLIALEILRNLCPKANFDQIVAEFKKVFETMEESRNILSTPSLSSETTLEKVKALLDGSSTENTHYGKTKPGKTSGRFMQILFCLKKEVLYLSAFLFIGLMGMGILFFQKDHKNKENQLQELPQQLSIRSDLVIPKESAFLSRSDLIGKIDSKFKKSKDIQTIALVGTGGAGKTTLARHYARQQNDSIVWEMNAETKESLIISFEELGCRLSHSPEDKRDLKEIQEMTNPVEKEKQLLVFLKKKLRAYPNWFLIYDNLELFPGFLKYFPCNSNDWGNGRVLITTRDGTLQNTTYVSMENIIPLGELRKQEAAELFIKILYDPKPLTHPQKEKILTFLQSIPSFPLDVSVAAYYIKNSHITPEIYLERIAQPSKQFEAVQEAIAKGVGEYAKTRYRIITLSLEYLINVDKAFGDLCLFISLLDSQNIPREILDKYKDAVVVDSFIYNLKKYSLITPGDTVFSTPSLSVHRSIQKIMLNHFSEAFGPEKTKEKIRRMASQMEIYADTITENEDRPKARLLINHYEMFLSHKNLLDRPIILLISGALGNIYYCVRDFMKSKQFLEKATDVLDKYYSPIHSIKFLITLAKVYVQLDDTQKVRKLCAHLSMVYNKFLPKNDIPSALVLISLGDMRDTLADSKTAQKLVKQGLQIYQKHYPKGFFIEARLLGILGNIYMKTGDYTKAKDCLEKGLARHSKLFPEDQYRIGWLSICLGNAYVGLEDYNKAKKFLETGVRHYKQHFPENHVAIAWASVYLANVYIKLENYKKAQELLEKDLIIYRKNFPPNHDGLIRTMTYLTDAYMGLENYKKAKPLLEETLLAMEQRYDEGHIKFAPVLQNLGKVYFLEGQMESAASTTHKALKIFLKNQDPESCQCLENLADVLIRQSSVALRNGDHKQSQVLKKQAVDYLKRALEMIKTNEFESLEHTRLQDKLNKLE